MKNIAYCLFVFTLCWTVLSANPMAKKLPPLAIFKINGNAVSSTTSNFTPFYHCYNMQLTNFINAANTHYRYEIYTYTTLQMVCLFFPSCGLLICRNLCKPSHYFRQTIFRLVYNQDAPEGVYTYQLTAQFLDGSTSIITPEPLPSCAKL